MLRYDYQESVIYWVISTSNQIQRMLNEELAPIGVTFRQAEVLGWLALEENALSQAELAKKMQLAAPTLGGIIDRMERDGWITRETCPSDRRKVILRPTTRVQPIWERILEVGHRVRERATAGFSPERLQMLLDSLAAVQDNLRNDDSRGSH